ncbi:DUF4440 domain-containing protein [Ruegeria sp. SCPT10]|uniref:YybH family protein n=1 Tax=Ruegeria sp. SCP10 TaxID=3141377 RepID=UPI00333631E2
MKHALAWATTLALSLPQILSAEGQNVTQDQQDVLAAVEHMTQSFMDNNIPEVMDSYEPKATVLFEPAVPITENTMLKEMFAGMAALNPVFEYPSGHDVVVNGDIAIHISPWTMAGKTQDGQAVAQNGLSIAVLRRQEDGSWKMVIDNPHGARLLATK